MPKTACTTATRCRTVTRSPARSPNDGQMVAPMPKLRFTTDWQSTGSGPVEVRETSAFLTLHAGETVFTRNEDLWSKTLRDSVLVSTYPLASWLAGVWFAVVGVNLPQK